VIERAAKAARPVGLGWDIGLDLVLGKGTLGVWHVRVRSAQRSFDVFYSRFIFTALMGLRFERWEARYRIRASLSR
jgi:hypothetical protein